MGRVALSTPRLRSRRRPPALGRVRLERKLWWVVAVFLLLTALTVAYNARETQEHRTSALIINVASRQRALGERYIKDVLLRIDGFPADPAGDARMLQENASALLDGGMVEAVQGADATINIPPANMNWKVVAKLKQEQRLIARLLDTGEALLRSGRAVPGLDDRLLRLRIIGAQLSTLTNDAVGEMTQDVDTSLGQLVRAELGLGLLGACAALAMAFLLRRAGAQRAAQFRSLVHGSSDLITVLDADSTIRYTSASAERIFGYPPGELEGRRLSDLIHPGDARDVAAGLEKLASHPRPTVRVQYRLRAGDGSWRHVESSTTNLLADPLVQGIVLNTRDVTDRVEAEKSLQKLQSERAKLLERTVQAAEQERKQMAAELHDGPVQHLTALDLRLERLRHLLTQTGVEAPVEGLEQVQMLLREEVHNLRRMMSELRPPVLDERGLVPALQKHVHAVGKEFGLECSVESRLETRLEPAQETVLYRVAQEALTNVVKHARASRAEVVLDAVNGHVLLEVRDDGIGFDPSLLGDFVRSGHFGLLGIRERVEMVGGRWHLDSSRGEGTTLRVQLPKELAP